MGRKAINTDRDAEIVRLWNDGTSLRELSEAFGLTRRRLRQITNPQIPQKRTSVLAPKRNYLIIVVGQAVQCTDTHSCVFGEIGEVLAVGKEMATVQWQKIGTIGRVAISMLDQAPEKVWIPWIPPPVLRT